MLNNDIIIPLNKNSFTFANFRDIENILNSVTLFYIKARNIHLYY